MGLGANRVRTFMQSHDISQPDPETGLGIVVRVACDPPAKAGTLAPRLYRSFHSYISSAGIRTFLKVARRLRGGAVELVLCAMPEETRTVFQITGFDRIISIYPTRAEALACLAPERAASESTGARRVEGVQRSPTWNDARGGA